MFTKPLTHHSIATTDLTEDISTIRRLLVAAAISPRFCANLLNEPGIAVRKGFGGEQFQLSESTMHLMTSIKVSTLPEFIHRLDETLSNRLSTTSCV